MTEKRKICVLTVLAVLLVSSGCVAPARYVPDHAFKQPIRGVSIPHPDNLEQAGVESITNLLVLMDASLFVEVIEKRGVWPILAKLQDGTEIFSFIYLFGLSWKGDFLLRAEFPVSQEDLAKAKILFFNRDAGYLYQLDSRLVGYNPKKFQKNKKYRVEVFDQHGQSLAELKKFWLSYCPSPDCTNGYPVIQEIRVGSPEWQAHKERLFKIMGYAYKDKFSGNKVVISHLELQEIREVATRLPGFTKRGRWFKHLTIPLTFVGFAGIDAAASIGTNLVGSAINASIKDDYEGHYARANALRIEMAPTFLGIMEEYKKLIEKKDEIIFRQRILLEGR